MRPAGEDPNAGLDRGELLLAAYPTTFSDGIADRQSWYSRLSGTRGWPERFSDDAVVTRYCRRELL
jgi:hypothetical protein